MVLCVSDTLPQAPLCCSGVKSGITPVRGSGCVRRGIETFPAVAQPGESQEPAWAPASLGSLCPML